MKALIGLSAVVCIATATAQEKSFTPSGKFSGMMYGEYFYNVDQQDAAKKNLNGFQFRRIYFTYDYNIAEQFSTRFRLEADQAANASNGKIGVFVKDAYLQWKNIFTNSDLFFGISPTPGFEISEAAWGYRSLEKTIMDLRGIVSARDIGVDLRGRLDGTGAVNYWVKIGNNSGNSPETNKYKRYYGNLHVKLSTGLQATVYGDYDTRANIPDSFDGQLKPNNRITLAGFASFAHEKIFSAGIEGLFQRAQNNFRSSPPAALQNQTITGLSLFAWYALSNDVRLVGRFDTYDPNTDLSNDGISLIIISLDYMPATNVHVMPNIYIQSYQENVASDVVARVTFGYSF